MNVKVVKDCKTKYCWPVLRNNTFVQKWSTFHLCSELGMRRDHRISIFFRIVGRYNNNFFDIRQMVHCRQHYRFYLFFNFSFTFPAINFKAFFWVLVDATSSISKMIPLAFMTVFFFNIISKAVFQTKLIFFSNIFNTTQKVIFK